MRSSAIFLMIALCFGFLGCQLGPTRVYETKENRAKGAKSTPLDEKTVLIDARPPFLSALAKPNGALVMQWTDFTQKEAPFEAYLEKDLFFHARRLARMGIGPDSDILVLGRGPAGEGEEGRLAWTLRRMGLRKVRFAALESIDWPMTRDEAPDRPEVPIWKPVVDESLELQRLEALARLKKEKEIVVLDTRPANDYLKDSDPFARLGLHLPVINIPWTEFLTSQGQLNPRVRERLVAIGILPAKTIFVIDEDGVRSAGTTLLLRDLGYSKATHWTGGYREVRWFLRPAGSR